MKILAENPAMLKYAVDAIGNIVEEGIFEIKASGIYLKAMDPSQISMITFSLSKEHFLEYMLEGEKKVGLDMDQLKNVFDRSGKNEKVELGVEGGRFIITFFAEKKKRTFKLPILDLGETLQKEPKIEFTNYVKISADALKEVIKDAKLLSAQIKLILNEDLFIAEVKSDSGDLRAEFEKNGEEISEIKAKQEVKATFPLQYLEDIIKACPSGEQLTLYLETDRPLKLEYKIYGAEIKYYLAPRVDQ